MAKYYRDLGDPLTERMAKAICRAYGEDPDVVVPETGNEDAEGIPLWFKKQNAAFDCLVILKELGLITERSNDT